MDKKVTLKLVSTQTVVLDECTARYIQGLIDQISDKNPYTESGWSFSDLHGVKETYEITIEKDETK